MGNNITSILLAAGLSRRMGQPKMLLPWNGTTVLGQVVSTFAAAGMEEILVITGGEREIIEGLVSQLALLYPVRAVFNPAHAEGGMLSSIKAGLSVLNSQYSAALIGLGDQPQVRENNVRSICATFVQTRRPLVVPSFQNRRGHPWLARRTIWSEILALPNSTTMRHFFSTHSGQVEYVAADESILQDLDTPEEYARQRP
jgi:molybdenum cofactor cytidylyltransferase